MKKIILTLALTTTFLTIQAQNKSHFGLKGGLNISTLTIKGINTSGEVCSKIGFHVGAIVAIPLANKWEIHPEMLYSNQGYIYKETTPEGEFKATGNLNYLAVPVMFAYFPAKKLSIEFGPQISFLLNHKAKVSYDSFDPIEPDISEVTVDYAEVTQSIEVGLNVGMGYKIAKNVFASGRYNFGLSTVNKKASNSDEEDRNSVFQFSLGYLFN